MTIRAYFSTDLLPFLRLRRASQASVSEQKRLREGLEKTISAAGERFPHR